MKHVSIDRNVKRYCLTIIFLAGTLLLQSCSSGIAPDQQIRSNWSIAVGKESDTITDVAGYTFSPISNLYNLERFVPDNYGIIWLQNTFTVPQRLAGQDLTMIIDYINPNDEIYVNGNFIGSTGTISDRHGTNFSDWNSVRKYDIHAGFLKSGTNIILIRIFANYEADFNGKILIGTGEPIHRYFIITDFLRTWLNMLIAGIILFISLNYLFIYVKRPKNSYHLYYTLFCFSIAIYQTNFFITKAPVFPALWISYLLYQKIVFFALVMFAYWGIRFFHAFTAQNRRYADWFFTVLFFAAACTILAIPDYKSFLFMRRLLVAIVGLSSISYLLFVSTILFRQKNPYIKSLTIGLLPLILSITYDVLFHNIFTLTTLNDTYFSFLGIPGFLIVIAFTLSSKYVQLQNEVEHLNENLEHKVSERTQELTIANNKVEETNRQLLIMSQTDSLTGLYNRRYFMDLFTVEFERAIRYENDLSFIILDIDHFKSINDTYGHQTGDAVLKKTADVVKSNLRKPDCICRYGGEEFCILLPQTNLNSAVVIAEKLRRTVNETLFSANESTIAVTASFGVTHFRKEDKQITDLIERADKALYEAKSNGRNRVELAA